MRAKTPAMAQYEEAKRQHPDALIFFRMGDFYEMFHEDAKLASSLLGLTLTARDKKREIPMAGVPVKAATGYMQKLLARGHKVAVCEQISNPATTKGLLAREVVRVLTPGTVMDDDALDPRISNYLIAVLPAIKKRDPVGLAWVDLSTGQFVVAEVLRDRWLDELARVQPAEVLVPDNERGRSLEADIKSVLPTTVTHISPVHLDRDVAARCLKEQFRVAGLGAFGLDAMPRALRAAGGALQYLRDTQRASLDHITRIVRHEPANILVMEQGTRRRLDLVMRRDGSRGGTLLDTIDNTKSAAGGRRLREWVLAPRTDMATISFRHEGVEEFVKDSFLRNDLRELMSAGRDIERICARVSTNRTNARDLVGLGRTLESLPALRDLLTHCYSNTLHELLQRIPDCDALAGRLAEALDEDPPAGLREGGMIRAGFDRDLDELRTLSRSGKAWISSYQAEEARRTGIAKLKVGYNRVFGYYIEVRNANKDKVPDDYIRKQTLTNAERYITPELKTYEEKVLRADERAVSREYDLFQELRAFVADHVETLQCVASTLATLDALAALATYASTHGCVRPTMTEEPVLEIQDGRHPVVEAMMPSGEQFVPNDTVLHPDRRVGLITGPNMAGKSTYIRQNALLVLLAQMGSFVPATKARIGIADRIFARVGAEDDLTRGQSTFMVEMSETAYILNHATSRSLIILDEVGRGTSTYDGIAIAWALTEYLSEVVGARTLFATHYHELTQLADQLPGVFNLNVAVSEWDDSIVFLRRIEDGSTDRSYGVHVARLAGVPDAVVDRSRVILATLQDERADVGESTAFGEPKANAPRDVQLGLFAPPPPDPVTESLCELDLNALTPLEALNKLAELQQRAQGKDV